MEIQHFAFLKDGEFRYLCNQAVNTTSSKRTNDYFKVTCKNCKRALDKEVKEKFALKQNGEDK